MSNLAELFQGLDDADVEGKRPKLDEGQYIVQIDATKIVKGYDSGQSFVIETKIVECLTPAVAPKYPAGKEVSMTINRLTSPKQGERELALGNLKGFLAAAFSDKFQQYIDPNSEQQWTKLAMMCAENEAMLAGCKVRVQVDWVETKRSKASGNPKDRFARHMYRALNAPQTAAA